MSDYTRRNEADELREQLRNCNDYIAKLEVECKELNEKLREKDGCREERRMADDLISRQAAIDIERNATVDTNPSHFEAHQKFTQFMDDAEISSFGRWQWSNGFNTALTAVGIDLKKLPSAQPTIDAVPVEWIPVSEQMPKEFKTVLVFALSDDGDHGFMTTASHEGRGIWYDECFYQPLPKVYAWMPLPEPYLVKF